MDVGPMEHIVMLTDVTNIWHRLYSCYVGLRELSAPPNNTPFNKVLHIWFDSRWRNLLLLPLTVVWTLQWVRGEIIQQIDATSPDMTIYRMRWRRCYVVGWAPQQWIHTTKQLLQSLPQTRITINRVGVENLRIICIRIISWVEAICYEN